jgi:hypothetical protein
MNTLIKKEIRLHEANLFIAIILLALHLTSFGLHSVLDRNVQRVFELVWSLWLLMPLLIGSAAVAEERKLGILESQLSLAVSRRVQLLVKFLVAFAFSIILGALMPSIIERTRDFGTGWSSYWIFAAAAALFVISFYASSLARTTLGALGLALIVAVAIYLYETTTWFGFLKRFPDGLNLLRFYLSVPILFFVLAALASWNFKRLHQNQKLWQRNLIVIFAAFAIIPLLAAAIYFRPWELLLSLEPREPVRIQDSAQVKFETSSQHGIDMLGNGIYSLSPDHRLWVERSAYYEVSNGLSSAGQSWVTVHAPGRQGQFVGGTNWVDFAVNDYATIAVQSTGTLWAIQGNGLTQIGADTNWSRAANGQDGFLLLKNDGSVWRWGTRIYYWHKGTSNPQIKMDVASLPVRVSDRTNWTALYSSGFLPYARNNDGNNGVLLGKRFVQETNVDDEWSELKFGMSPMDHLEISANGELLYWEGMRENSSRKVHLGQNMKWRAATFDRFGMAQAITAIRSDGTLWLFQYPMNSPLFPSTTPRPLGHRSDWVAVATGCALASDGSIWNWEPRTAYAWLAPSRRPAYMGNIFKGTSETP